MADSGVAQPVYVTCDDEQLSSYHLELPAFKINNTTLIPAIKTTQGEIISIIGKQRIRAPDATIQPRVTSDSQIITLFRPTQPRQTTDCHTDDFTRCLQTGTLLFLDRGGLATGSVASLLDFMLVKRALLVGPGRITHLNSRSLVIVAAQHALQYRQLHAWLSAGEFCALFPALHDTLEMKRLIQLIMILREQDDGNLEYEIDYYIHDGGQNFWMHSRNPQLQTILNTLGCVHGDKLRVDTAIFSLRANSLDYDGVVLLQNPGTLDFDHRHGAMVVTPGHFDYLLYREVAHMVASYCWTTAPSPACHPAFIVGRYCFYQAGAEPPSVPHTFDTIHSKVDDGGAPASAIDDSLGFKRRTLPPMSAEPVDVQRPMTACEDLVAMSRALVRTQKEASDAHVTMLKNTELLLEGSLMNVHVRGCLVGTSLR